MDSSISTKIKCSICHKKINLIEQLTSKCRCDNYYCKNHKFAGVGHDCSYDYKINFVSEFIKQNMKIISVKVDKI
jgi:hypothetical protein